MYLGIDTSCYTTSLSLVSQAGTLCADSRMMLPVSAGEQGLRQSQALFYHIRNLPQLLEDLQRQEKRMGQDLQGIAVSSRPCPKEDSYMPVFQAGTMLARSLAAVMDIPLLETSHQEGHLVAGFWSAGLQETAQVLAVHLSGGTSEILLARRLGEHPLCYDIECLGGSTDIQAGQLVDRVGVAMGCSFPAGPALEQLALQTDPEQEKPLTIPSSVKGMNFSFSGAETRARKYLEAGGDKPQAAEAVFLCIARTLEKVLRAAIETTGIRTILLVGGVASNHLIRSYLHKKLGHPSVGAALFFPEPRYCRDNAVGVGFIARSLRSSG